MAYNHDDQRTVPGVLQGVTAQNIGSGSEAIANSSGVQAPGNPNPQDARPGFLAAGFPGGSSADVLVPGGQYNTDNQIQTVAAPAGTAGGGGMYPAASGAGITPVQNPMVAQAWTAQTSTGDTFSQIEITTASPLPNAAHTVAYSQQLAAIGGSGSYTWSLGAGTNLPSALTLSAGGLLSGTPAAAGAATFLVKIVDSHGNAADKVFSLTIT